MAITDTPSTETPTEPAAKSLHIMDDSGDLRIEWDPTNDTQVDIARAAFEKARGEGMIAYEVEANGPGRRLREFDPDAERIVMMPPPVPG